MSKLADKCYYNYMGKTPVGVGLDKPTYDTFTNIIWQVIEALKACKKTDSQVVTVAHNPKPDDVKVVKKAVRKNLGFFRNLFSGTSYVDAVLKAGSTSTLEEIKEIYV